MSGLINTGLAAALFAIAGLAATYMAWLVTVALKSGIYTDQQPWPFFCCGIKLGRYNIRIEYVSATIMAAVCAALIFVFVKSSSPPWHGWLQAANDPTPENGCESSNGPVPKDAPLMIFGTNAVQLTRDGKTKAVSIGDCSNLVLERTPDGIRANAALYDANGNHLGHIINNEYTVDRDPSLTVERSGDLSTLVVHNQSGSEILYIRYVNLRAIKIRGSFSCPSIPGLVLTITDKRMTVNRNHSQRSFMCSSDAAGVCILCGPNSR